MSIPHPAASLPSPRFQEAFLAEAGPGRRMAFDRFVELALYHPELGYYRRGRRRVGPGPETDFVTSTSTGPLFGELMAAAAVTLLGKRDPRRFTWIEIGAEGPGILDGVEHPFAAARTLRLGEPLALSGPSIVFSNELFDAQPFRRFVRRHGAWRELGVALDEGGRLAEVELASPNVPPALAALDPPPPEGYGIDAPTGSVTLLSALVSQPWTGLFLACDYGRTWAELVREYPAGTARGYFRHRQESDLLARPGEQDLTCHVCWDWLGDVLRSADFAAVTLASQEAFLVAQAGDRIAALIESEAGQPTRRKAALMQLIHPAHFGQKFQVLSAIREPEPH